MLPNKDQLYVVYSFQKTSKHVFVIQNIFYFYNYIVYLSLLQLLYKQVRII